jgi:hypothetical protein
MEVRGWGIEIWNSLDLYDGSLDDPIQPDRITLENS